MKILIGLAIILIAIAIMLVAALVSERKKRAYWFESFKEVASSKLDLQRQLIDERKHSDLLQKEIELNAVGTIFADWKCVEDIGGSRDCYLEKDGIRLIIDDGQCIGWYKPSDTSYKAPKAERVKD